MPPRYSPLSVDSAGATYRPNAPTAAPQSLPPRSAFHCACIPAVATDLWEWIALRIPRSKVVGYLSGILFALGWWVFIDGVTFSATHDPPLENSIRFDDWLPGILSTVSMIIVNLINKETLTADDFSYSGTNVACKARAAAFVGVTMALGALGGALAILSLKYVMPGLSGDDFYFGITITVQNLLIFVGSMILWFGRNSEQNDYNNIAI